MRSRFAKKMLHIVPLSLFVIGSYGVAAGAAGAGYEGTPPSLTGPGGASMPVITVGALSAAGENTYAELGHAKLHVAVPVGDFIKGEQLVVANGASTPPIYGYPKVLTVEVAVYRHGASLNFKFAKGLNLILISNSIKLGDRVFEHVGTKWLPVKTFRFSNGRVVISLASPQLIEVVGP